MQDKFYKLISNILELSDSFEERISRLERALESQLIEDNSINEKQKKPKNKFLES